MQISVEERIKTREEQGRKEKSRGEQRRAMQMSAEERIQQKTREK